MFEELRNTCMDIKEQMGQQLFLAAARGRMPSVQETADRRRAACG